MFLSGFAACHQNQTVGSGQGWALMNNPVNGSKLEALEEKLWITRVFIIYIYHYAFPVCKPNNNQNSYAVGVMIHCLCQFSDSVSHQGLHFMKVK